MARTNAVRILERLGVSHALREYEVDPNDLAAETVAAKIGVPSEQVFKTLAVRGDAGTAELRAGPVKGHLLRGDGGLSLNKAAAS